MILRRLLEEQDGLFHLDHARTLTAREHKPAYPPDGDSFSKPQARDVKAAVRGMLDDLDRGRSGPNGIRSPRRLY